jgi:hypothetical protein
MRGNSDRNASLKIGNRLFERFGIFFEEKPPTLPATERTEQLVGVVTLQEPNIQAVGQLSLWVGHESDNGHGTAQNEKPGLAGLVRDFTEPLRPQSGRSYAPLSRRSDYLGESEAAGL